MTGYPGVRLVDQSTGEFMRVRIIRRDDTESPGSDGASPYLPGCPANDVTLKERLTECRVSAVNSIFRRGQSTILDRIAIEDDLAR